MLKVPDALRDIVTENPFLEFGLANRLCNLSQLAKFLRPMVEARTMKDVQPSAIVMALSRLQRQKEKMGTLMRQISEIENISVYSNLGTMTFYKSATVHTKIHKLYSLIHEKDGYFCFSESNGEITIFFERDDLETVRRVVDEEPKYENLKISSIGVRFDEKYIHIPGHLYSILQKLNFQNINLIEISSTATEFNLYLDDKDVKLAFETLHHCFNV